MKVNLRVSAIVFYQGGLVVVKHTSSKFGDYYLLPGGGWENGESIEQCAIREVKEETGLNVKVNNLSYYKSVYTEEDQTLDLVFSCNFVSGTIRNEDPSGKVVSIEIIKSEQDLSKLNFHPKQLKDQIFRKNSSNKALSLGNARYPE